MRTEKSSPFAGHLEFHKKKKEIKKKQKYVECVETRT
jgi:hypothetical protein